MDSLKAPPRRTSYPESVSRGLYVAGIVALGLTVSASHAHAQAMPRRGQARAERMVRLGERYLEAGDRGSAIGYFRDAIQADPGATRAYLRLGQAYLGRGSLPDARTVLEAGLVRDPDAAELWLALVEVLRAMGEPEDAARAVRSLLARAPAHPDGLRARADLARERGAWSEALTAYRRLLSEASSIGLSEEEISEARRYEAALRLLASPMDPLSAPRSCSGSPIRRALARCD